MLWRLQQQPGDDPAPQKRLWGTLRSGRAWSLCLVRTAGVCVCLSAIVFGRVDAARAAPPDSSVAEWPAYGRDPGGSRYSPLTQITRDNVARLQVAWTYRTGEDIWRTVSGDQATFETTPIVVDGTLYLSTPFNRVIALDPETGAERWRYDPKVDVSLRYAETTSRGVSTWLDQDRPVGTPCRRRIFVATIDGRLIALDAATGTPCQDFGQYGQVDLTRDVRLVRRGMYGVTSPPAVLGALVIVGSAIGDNRGVQLERGVVRAYEARTGQLRWGWDPIPQDAADPARSTWEGDSATRTGAANAWAVISADPARDLVFVPTSSPSPDFYGGERKGSNLYANAVVALRASTGTVVWSFQVVHHDLWDYDVASQPTLVTLTRDGQDIPAVAVGTKMGHLFVLHRDTGAPLFPVEERPVPPSTVPGEAAWPTQPFPTVPPPLVPQQFTPEDAWGSDPTERDWCHRRIKALRSEGIFTPPSLEGTVVFPGFIGGMHWGGLAYEPTRGFVFVNTNRIAYLVKLIPRQEYEKLIAPEEMRPRGDIAPQVGTPYAVYREVLLGPSRLPCNAPPWGTLAAVDLATGVVRWEVPLGRIPPLYAFPGTADWGSFNLGGSLVTGGSLVFIAAAADDYLRAFDVETGKELWKGQLPASAQATPMTYRLSEQGKQFVVIAAGGHGRMRTKLGDYVIAYTLHD
jgi:quinoprotein glucose dehydrogenase